MVRWEARERQGQVCAVKGGKQTAQKSREEVGAALKVERESSGLRFKVGWVGTAADRPLGLRI